MVGDYSPATSTSTHTYKDASGNIVTQTYKTEELRTVLELLELKKMI